MMSGLLDKANETAKDIEDSDKAEKSTAEESESTVFIPFETTSQSGMNTNQLLFQLGAVFLFILSMIIVFFIDTVVIFDGFTVDDLLIPLVIISWLVFNGSDLKQKEFDLTKLGVSGIVILLLTGGTAAVAIFSASDTGVTIANVEYDGDNNELDLSFYGPSGMDYTIEILANDNVEYSHDATISVDKGTHSVDFDDFWKGNAEYMNGKDRVVYEIKVKSDGGDDSMTFDSIANREIDTAFVRATEVFETDSDGHRTYNGITVEMIVGMGMNSGSSGASFDFADGFYTGTPPKTITSDWTADVVVKGGNQYSYNTITADEGLVSGLGEFQFNWVSLNGQGYLDRSDFYDDDGCYTFEVTIVNEHGQTFTSSVSRIEFFWDSNEATSDSSDDQKATAC